jgi:hypothetical protein
VKEDWKFFISKLIFLVHYFYRVTGLMAALVTEGTEALQVALAHLLFNVFGILIWYPIPFMRRIPMYLARQLGKATRAWKGFPFLYILIAFFAFPLLMLAVSSLFSSKKTGQVVVASIIIVILIVGIVALVYWWAYRGGRDRAGAYFAQRQRRVMTLETLPYDMAWAERRTKEIQLHTGITPAKVVAKKTEGLDIYANVANEMDYVTKMVKSLVSHVGLESDVDSDGLGRSYNKSKEQMPDVDMMSKRMYKLTIVVIGAVCLALYLWGVGVLFRTGSVATKGLAGWLLVMLGLFLTWRVHERLTGNGAALSDAAYIDRQLKKMYRDSYTKRMAQLTADIDKVAVESALHEIEGDKYPSADEGTNGATDEELST